MSDKEQIIHCPYCGTEMQLYYEQSCFSDCSYVAYRCPKCLIHSPMKEINYLEPGSKAHDEAYISAITRWKEPNHVLTIAEIKTYNGFVWCESIYGNTFTPGYVENQKLYVDSDVDKIEEEAIDSYGILWRCWLRKPSEKERESVCWEKRNE